MLGFDVARPDGTTARVEATHYDVADDGSLVVFADGNEVFRAEPAAWIEIRGVGTRLTSTWPPEDLDLLLDDLGYRLGVGFGYTQPGGVGPASSYESGLMNELESLTAAVLERVGLDADARGNRREANAVREIIRRHFRHRAAPPRR